MADVRFDKMTVSQLKNEQKKRGILDTDIKGQGKNGAILKFDRVVALDKYESTKVNNTKSKTTKKTESKSVTLKTTKKSRSSGKKARVPTKSSKSPTKKGGKKGGNYGISIRIWNKNDYDRAPESGETATYVVADVNQPISNVNMEKIIRNILINQGNKEDANDNVLVESIVRNMPGGTLSETIRYIDAQYGTMIRI